MFLTLVAKKSFQRFPNNKCRYRGSLHYKDFWKLVETVLRKIETVVIYSNNASSPSYFSGKKNLVKVSKYWGKYVYTVKKIDHSLKHVKTNLRFFGLS